MREPKYSVASRGSCAGMLSIEQIKAPLPLKLHSNNNIKYQVFLRVLVLNKYSIGSILALELGQIKNRLKIQPH